MIRIVVKYLPDCTEKGSKVNSFEQEKRKHSIIDWTLTVMFILAMIVIILSMKEFMATDKILYISGTIGLIALFAYAKVRLAKWGKRLTLSEKDSKN